MSEMNFMGTAQTNYGDWAKTLVERYPANLKYKREGDIVVVFQFDKRVAEYNFGNGTGKIVNAPIASPPSKKLPNYAPIDVDSMVIE